MSTCLTLSDNIEFYVSNRSLLPALTIDKIKLCNTCEYEDLSQSQKKHHATSSNIKRMHPTSILDFRRLQGGNKYAGSILTANLMRIHGKTMIFAERPSHSTLRYYYIIFYLPVKRKIAGEWANGRTQEHYARSDFRQQQQQRRPAYGIALTRASSVRACSLARTRTLVCVHITDPLPRSTRTKIFSNPSRTVTSLGRANESFLNTLQLNTRGAIFSLLLSFSRTIMQARFFSSCPRDSLSLRRENTSYAVRRKGQKSKREKRVIDRTRASRMWSCLEKRKILSYSEKECLWNCVSFSSECRWCISMSLILWSFFLQRFILNIFFMSLLIY